MFDEVTAKRLDRLESETRRRQWDSTIMTAAKVQWDEAIAPPPNAPAPIDRPLVDLLAERFDRLERANRRLEWQIDQVERGQRFWKRACTAALIPMALALALVGYVAAAHALAALNASRGASASAPPLDDQAGRSGSAWVMP
jgi:hypothetical protein